MGGGGGGDTSKQCEHLSSALQWKPRKMDGRGVYLGLAAGLYDDSWQCKELIKRHARPSSIKILVE